MTWLWITLGVLVAALLIYKIATAKKSRRRKNLASIRAKYGVIPNEEYTAEELEKIKSYYEAIRDEEYVVDDITWNDLDLDLIFIAMNRTFSSCGEEVLYDLLREPAMDKETMERREKLITYFAENPEIREEFQLDYYAIGKVKKYSLADFISTFKTVELKSTFSHLIHSLLLIPAIASIFFSPAIGILILVGVIIYNFYTYFKEKGKIEAYYTSLSSLARLVKGAERLKKHNEPELKPYIEAIEEESSYVKSLSKDMAWLGSSGTVGSSSDVLQILLDYLRVLTHVDFIKFNNMVKKVLDNELHLMNLYHTMGFLEAMIAIGSYRLTIPYYCKPEFTDEPMGISMQEGYHPMITEPVANSIEEKRPILLTGSNASGKSTFLKTVAISQILAQTVNTVPAKAFKTRFYHTYTSMALQDDLLAGESYFIVEIKSLKRIMDAASGEVPVLCFVDEVLRGTNTVERIAASSEILRMMAEKKSMCFAATHDIELTKILEKDYSNYHFEEEVEDGQVSFNYALKTGRATSRNAIKLLAALSYDQSVVDKAEKMAERFVEDGTWELC